MVLTAEEGASGSTSNVQNLNLIFTVARIPKVLNFLTFLFLVEL